MLHIRKLKAIQEKFAEQVNVEADFTLKDGMRIAGFDCAVLGEDLICAATVLEYPSFKVIEKKTLKKQAPIPYLPTLFCFREGPLMLELYYNLESDPNLLIVDGHGVAHPDKCGLATYLGIETHRPTIGIGKNTLRGVEIEEEDVTVNGEIRGKLVKTRAYANPLIVSPGNLITIESAADTIAKLIKPPHKLPEPLHAAHRLANSSRKKVVKGESPESTTHTDETEEDESYEE